MTKQEAKREINGKIMEQHRLSAEAIQAGQREGTWIDEELHTLFLIFQSRIEILADTLELIDKIGKKK